MQLLVVSFGETLHITPLSWFIASESNCQNLREDFVLNKTLNPLHFAYMGQPSCMPRPYVIHGRPPSLGLNFDSALVKVSEVVCMWFIGGIKIRKCATRRCSCECSRRQTFLSSYELTSISKEKFQSTCEAKGKLNETRVSHFLLVFRSTYTVVWSWGGFSLMR